MSKHEYRGPDTDKQQPVQNESGTIRERPSLHDEMDKLQWRGEQRKETSEHGAGGDDPFDPFAAHPHRFSERVQRQGTPECQRRSGQQHAEPYRSISAIVLYRGSGCVHNLKPHRQKQRYNNDRRNRQTG